MKQRLIPKGQSGLLTTPFTYQDFISLLDPKTQKIIQDKAIADEAIATNPTIQTSLKDKPLSPNDPVGEFYVGTAAGKILEYPIKLIGKAALYGLGRLGNKWARAKLISGALNNSALKYYGAVKYYGPTMGKTTAAKTNPDIVDMDDYAREATKALAKKHGLTKQLLQISPRLELEYKNMLLGLMEKWRTDPNNAFKTLVVSKKVLANEPIYNNIPSIPDRATFLKRLALRGERFPFRADDYYDALKSANPNLKINNNFVSDLEYNPHYISVESLPIQTNELYRDIADEIKEASKGLNNETFKQYLYRFALDNPKDALLTSQTLPYKYVAHPIEIKPTELDKKMFESMVFSRLRRQRPWMNNVGENFDYNNVYAYNNDIFDKAGSPVGLLGEFNTRTGNIIMKKYPDYPFTHQKIKFHEYRHRADIEYPLTEQEEKIASKAYDGFQNALPEDYSQGYDMTVEIPTTNGDARNRLLELSFKEMEKSPGFAKDYKNWYDLPLELLNAIIDDAYNDEIIDAFLHSNGYGKRFMKYLRDNNKLTPERIQDLKEAMKIIGVSASMYPLINQKQNDIRRNNN